MSSEEIEAQYANKLLDLHLSHGTPASHFLTWGNLMKSLSLVTDTCLNGLDWDTIPSLFDRLDEVKTTHIDLDIASSRWFEKS